MESDEGQQRIGRIDRLGQRHERIRIINMHYQDTVEADVYVSLPRKRIDLFKTFVGKLQPILSTLPGKIGRRRWRQGTGGGARNLATQVENEAAAAEAGGFDLDEIAASDLEEPLRPPALYDLEDLGRILMRSDLLPPDWTVKTPSRQQPAIQGFFQPGMVEPDPHHPRSRLLRGTPGKRGTVVAG